MASPRRTPPAAKPPAGSSRPTDAADAHAGASEATGEASPRSPGEASPRAAEAGFADAPSATTSAATSKKAQPVHPDLHPRLAKLLDDQGWTDLTAAQEAALHPLSEGKHALIVAPTGHGKTEAALIPVLSRMLKERDVLLAQKRRWPIGFKAIYVTPLRALNRDLMGRLESWGKALGFRIGVRHGDTSQGERAKQAKDPPDLLITTPETLQLLLYGDTLRRHLATVRFVIVDEIHDLAVSERGGQLLVALERIEEVIGQAVSPEAVQKATERIGPTASNARPGGGFQRIGLSATVADPDSVARLLGGQEAQGVGSEASPAPAGSGAGTSGGVAVRARPVEVVRIAAQKQIRLAVSYPEPGPDAAELCAKLTLPLAAVAQVEAVRALVAAHERVLVFSNTRDGAELLASRSALMDTELGREPVLGLHHGSLSAEHRADVETRFKQGELRALVATSSLELGIDVGAIDHVVQLHSPRSVARLVQRLGRSGHTVTGIADGTLLAAGPEDVLECLAVARRARTGRLEPLRMRDSPLVVLANQIVALSNEYAGLDREWTRRLMRRAGIFRDLDDDLFDAVWDALLELKTLYPDDDRPQRIGRSGRGRRHFLEHISLIPDERAYKVIDESTKRGVGSVDDAFVAAAMPPGALFIMAGRPWQVLEVQVEERRVRVAPAKDIAAVPQWTGSQLPVSFEVAQEVAHLRGELAAGVTASAGAEAPAQTRAVEAPPSTGKTPARRATASAAAGAQPPIPSATRASAPTPTAITKEAARSDSTPVPARLTAPEPAIAGLDPRARDIAAEPILQQLEQGLAVPTDKVVTLDVGKKVVIANVALGTRGNEALARITQALLHQRLGSPVGVDSDAYRIHFTLPAQRPAQEIADLWSSLTPQSLDLLLSLSLRDSPLLRHHLVHVAKLFGALPSELDPNQFSRAKLDQLLANPALEEEAISRLVWDRMDIDAVADFLGKVQRKEVTFVVQAIGPISLLGQEETRRLMAPPKSNEALLAAVRKRIEDSDILLACCSCGNSWASAVHLLPRRIACRRCQSIQVACLRPWNEDKVPLLRRKDLNEEERQERERLVRNGSLVASMGPIACKALVARGIGPETAARILQKVSDAENPSFWREVLQAELTFARTNAFWKR